MLGRGWRIGRIGSVEIRVDPSWTVIALLITINLSLEFSDRTKFPDVSGSGAALGLAILSTVLIFGSVLAHELAHAGMSVLRGIPVSGITLFLFGGATRARVESKGPADEFLVTVVGPATSAALGALFLLGHSYAHQPPNHPAEAILRYLAVVNLLMAGFNMLPGFPLDGGRLLRSALWRATGNLARATDIAARVGQVVGLLLVAGGILLVILYADLLAGGWPALIGWFLFRAASFTRVDARRRAILDSTTVRDVMAPPPPTIDADLDISAATDRYLAGHDGEAFPVVRDNRVVGFVSLRTARDVPGDRKVQEAMVESPWTVAAGPGEPMNRVIDRVGEEGGKTVLVFDQGRLIGVIEAEDLARFLRRRTQGLGDGTDGGPIVPPRPDR
jgi:Zn-dependent protease/predicted transcriptional regulator